MNDKSLVPICGARLFLFDVFERLDHFDLLCMIGEVKVDEECDDEGKNKRIYIRDKIDVEQILDQFDDVCFQHCQHEGVTKHRSENDTYKCKDHAFCKQCQGNFSFSEAQDF